MLAGRGRDVVEFSAGEWGCGTWIHSITAVVLGPTTVNSVGVGGLGRPVMVDALVEESIELVTEGSKEDTSSVAIGNDAVTVDGAEDVGTGEDAVPFEVGGKEHM